MRQPSRGPLREGWEATLLIRPVAALALACTLIAQPLIVPAQQSAQKAQSAAPQVPPGSTNPVQVLRNQVDELLQQYYTGKFAPEPVPPAKKTPAQAPPPPSPHTGTRGPTR